MTFPENKSGLEDTGYQMAELHDNRLSYNQSWFGVFKQIVNASTRYLAILLHNIIVHT